MSDNLENLLVKTLSESCRAYLRHGAAHLFAKSPTRDDLLQAILNIQASIEAIAKLYQLQANGWKVILEKKHLGEVEAELIRKLNVGNLRTTGYEDSKKQLIERQDLEKADAELLGKLQGYRNAVAHLGMPALPSAVSDEIKKIIVRVLNALVWKTLAAGWTDFLENRSAIVFGSALFAEVMADACYVDEAIELAHEKACKVRNCPECWKPTLGEVDFEDTAVLCFCCGYGIAEMMVEFGDCPICNSKGNLLYDGLNTENLNPVGAMCLDCRQKMDVVKCPECSGVWLNMPGGICEDCRTSQI